MKKISNRQKIGFTLAEMAIVVLLMGIVATMGMKMIVANLDNAAYAETKSKQKQIKTALIGFLRSNGRLPCPDKDSPADGLENTPCSASAALGYGVVPWATLGLARDVAIDGWSNFFTYRVANVKPAPNAPAVPLVQRAHNANQNWTAIAGFDIDSYVTKNSSGFTSLEIDQGDGVAAPAAIAFHAVVVLYSHGKNGLGASTIHGTTNSAPTGADEIVNAQNTSTRFIIRPYTESTAANGGAYDDVIDYMTPQDLLGALIDEKTLAGACIAYCSGTPPISLPCSAAGVPIGNPTPTCNP